MSTLELIKSLRKNRLLRTPEEIAAFEAALANLPEDEKPTDRYLHNLFMVFDDEAVHHEVMWGLLHYLESFQDEDYLPAFVGAAPDLSANAPEWTEILTARILNNQPSHEAFESVLRSADLKSRDAVSRVLKQIAGKEAPPLATYAEALLNRR